MNEIIYGGSVHSIIVGNLSEDRLDNLFVQIFSILNMDIKIKHSNITMFTESPI